ncbi:MFS transporter [Aeromicrobium sp. CF4.19]|uniref:MFS transporter n=1 Tax=Aeromicrobium sp. CF4.19 TaxID=3373082 RepID=UPI003EE63E53
MRGRQDGRPASETPQHGILGVAALRRVVGVLCLTEIVSWGVLYYAFTVLSPMIVADTGWSTPGVVAAFSLGQVVCAVGSVPAGRLMDAFGPRAVMTTGSLLAGPALCGIALAPTYPLFLLAWAVAGVAMAAVLYAPSFAAVTGWAGSDVRRRVRALTAITLVAGLASTVFAPLTAAIATQLDWRETYLVLAVVLAAITVPAHAIGLHHPWRPERSVDRATRKADAASRRRPFVVLALSFGLVSFTLYAVLVNLVPLLVEQGVSVGAAAWVLGIGGVGQVVGRLVYAPLATRTGLVPRTASVFGLVVVTTAAFAVVPGPVVLLAVISFLAGTARGAATLLQATAVSDRWGTVDFGHHNGLLTAPIMIAAAVAPWAGAALAGPLGGYAPAFAVLAGIAVVGALLVPFTVPRGHEQTAP